MQQVLDNLEEIVQLSFVVTGQVSGYWLLSDG
jgi:hypothetical protein